MSDTVGAGSLDFGIDGRKANGGWEKGASGLRTAGQRSILECNGGAVVKVVERPTKRLKTDSPKREPTRIVNPFTPFVKDNGTIRETSWTSHESSPSHLLSPLEPTASMPEKTEEPSTQSEGEAPVQVAKPQIFADLVLYVNGSCGPDISDHRLKQIWCKHGGRTSVHLGRKTVSHVVIGKPSSSGNGGCGGGLAGSKIHKEIVKTGGAHVKYVTADWVTESLKAGKRLPESRFAALKLAPKGVNSVASIFAQRLAIKDHPAG